MSLLVTGASGRLGRLLIDRLAAAGGEIRVLSRETGEGRAFHKGVVLCRGDLLDPSTLAEAVAYLPLAMTRVDMNLMSPMPLMPTA